MHVKYAAAYIRLFFSENLDQAKMVFIHQQDKCVLEKYWCLIWFQVAYLVGIAAQAYVDLFVSVGENCCQPNPYSLVFKSYFLK